MLLYLNVDLKRNLPADRYYVMIKVIDYQGQGKAQFSLGGTVSTADTLNDDWNKYWTLPVAVEGDQSFNKITVNFLKTVAPGTETKFLFRGLYFTTNANENIPLYGYDELYFSGEPAA